MDLVPTPSIVIGADKGIPEQWFYIEYARRGLCCSLYTNWSCNKLKNLDEAVFVSANVSGSRTTATFEGETSGKGLINFTLDSGTIWANVYGQSRSECEELMKTARKLAPKARNASPEKVDVMFWYLGSHGPVTRRRSLVVPTWDDITINYTERTRSGLSKMMSPKWRPGPSGQLVLWYGEPGTGKTTALRALARQWKDWADIHYVTDPEQFFGSRADYMMGVLMNDDSKWRVLVLEDAGELMSSDAKLRTGGGLGRFLNSVDGLIGQGLEFVVLVTTNEMVGKLHPAVSRPGRCAAKIEFGPLSDDEVGVWLEANGRDGEEMSSGNLASLYSNEDEDGIAVTIEKKFGFAA